MAALERQTFAGGRLITVSLAISAASWIGVIVGFRSARVATYFGYLTAFSFATSIALGALVFLMVAYVVQAKWNTAVRRLNECIVSVFPLLLVLFIPVALGMDDLYLWAEPPAGLPEHELHLLEHRRGYLNETAFVLRSVGYFALWTTCAGLLTQWSLRRDRSVSEGQSGPRSVASHGRERSFSAALLPFVALALTFASFDWLMSLQPFWMSSIFGVYYFAGGFVAAFGLLSVLAYFAGRAGDSAAIRGPHFHALGRLMFGFTVFWAYCAFFQALLIALPNRPEEVVFYQQRLTRGWAAVAWTLAIVRFAVPFLMLLPREIKFSGAAMAGLGAWIIAGHYIDMFWLVAPVYAEHAPVPNLWDVCALGAVAGPCVAFAGWWLRGRAIIPIGDPLLPASIAYRSPS